MVSDSSHAEVAQSGSELRELDSLERGLPQQYEVLGRVSQGGMGSILKVRNRYTGAKYAVKVLRPEAARNRESVERFIVEAKMASALKHPNICRVFDFGITDDGIMYLVMDWIDGIDLEQKVRRDRRLTSKEAILVFQQAAAGLAYAHQYKLVHRDVKPQNIMLSRDESGRTVVHIVDFGIAKVLDDENSERAQGLTSVGMVVGTPLFMSPEQASAGMVDHRADIYALGCVMYYALVGRPPFVGRTAIETVTKHLNETPPEPPPSLNIPSDLKLIMLKAMEKKAEDRYASMEQLAVDLKKLTKGVGIEHRPLASQRQSTLKKLKVLLWFIVGFGLTYTVSVVLQNALDNGAPQKKSIQQDRKQPQNQPASKQADANESKSQP